jgi:hypothetical protein
MLLPRSLTVVTLGFVAVLVSAPAPSGMNRKQAVESTVRQDTPPASCHVTLPSDGWNADSREHQFRFGSEKLWTVLPADGTWRGSIPQKPFDFAYDSKIVWVAYIQVFRGKAGRS